MPCQLKPICLAAEHPESAAFVKKKNVWLHIFYNSYISFSDCKKSVFIERLHRYEYIHHLSIIIVEANEITFCELCYRP